ncbi:MAG: ATP-binding protein [Clostridiaceae bacterium]|nr:ATP-binding protein [Clostridiaceae bacterium]
MNEKKLSFKISTALKDIIGKDLISDKYIAIFELVKNSYDALAHNVLIEFIADREETYNKIIICDDGIGMDYSDIVNKWLFVAYSEKKEKNRTKSYREKIYRSAAGAKGVGRFSCDRLGSSLDIITKKQEEKSFNKLSIDWDQFDIDDEKQFGEVIVEYEQLQSEEGIRKNGTKLIISNLREHWDRADIIKLKKALMKLVNPEFDDKDDKFSIQIKSDIDKVYDEKVEVIRDRVNGIIINDVFETLNIKTTNIRVQIAENGEQIETQLYDRGNFIFSIKEKNIDYPLLHNISSRLFYLNRSAKSNFTRTMGLHNVNYGSVFIYKNGFRVMPYGEPGEDFCNIDKRKAQGYRRYFGTREILGRISINDPNDDFTETSSRAHGFVSNSTVDQLDAFFLKKVLIPLEKYVVNIIAWGEPLKGIENHVIQPTEVTDKIIEEFASVARKSSVLDVKYNEELIKSQMKNSESVVQSIKKLENVAEKTNNQAMLDLAKTIKKRTEEILKVNVELEKQNREVEKQIDEAKNVNKAREKQVFFLKGVTDKNVVNLINGMHTVFTLSEVVRGNTETLNEMFVKDDFDKNMAKMFLGEIYKSILKINKLSELAIKGNQSLKQSGSNNLLDYMAQYIEEETEEVGLRVSFESNNELYLCKFDTISIGIIIDNILSNSQKAGATDLNIVLSENDSEVITRFIDNGVGMPKGMTEEILFEFGITNNRKNKGFGIGLNHIKILVEEMDGIVHINSERKNGFEIEMRLKK